MKQKFPEFVTLIDDGGKPFFSVNPEMLANTRGFWPDRMRGGGKNICSFLSDSMEIGRKETGMFSTDLTTRDDLLLAFLSLLLLLVFDGILTAVLLRRNNGRVNNFAFAVKHFFELAREFKFGRLAKGAGRSRGRDKLNVRLLIVASSILLVTFGLEVGVLYATTPGLTNVTNERATFTMLAHLFPKWEDVRNSSSFFSEKPCTAISLIGVDQASTTVTACMGAAISGDPYADFGELQETDVEIVSDMHKYGAEHKITIGGVQGQYIVRGYYEPEQGAQRFLQKRTFSARQEVQLGAIHKQFLAFLYTIYNRETGSEAFTLEQLRGLKFEKEAEATYGPPVDIVKVQRREKFRRVVTYRYTTKVRAVMPAGPRALQFAQPVLKASVGVGIGKPDVYDLKFGSGQFGPNVAVLWKEDSRQLNWLSLSLILGFALVALGVLKVVLKPVGIAEIAGIIAAANEKDMIGAAPLELQVGDEKFFTVEYDAGVPIGAGAETRELGNGKEVGDSGGDLKARGGGGWKRGLL